MAVFTAYVAPQPSYGRALNKNDKKRIECAMFKVQVLANFFDVKMPSDKKTFDVPAVCGEKVAGQKITMPKWFEPELQRMDKVKVLYIPDEGTLSEADLWYRAFANVYAYLDRADKSLDPSQPIVFTQLSRGFVGNRINLVASLDRLNKDLPRGNKQVYNMKDSMEGRGRTMLSTFELMNHEFYSTIESFNNPDRLKEDKYRQSVMAVVVLSNHLYSQFMGSALPMTLPPASEYTDTRADRAVTTVMVMLGAFLVGVAVFVLIAARKEDVMTMMAQYREKSVIWAEDFNRQFLTIDVKYIVFGTLGLFILFGGFMGWAVGGFLGVLIGLILIAVGGSLSVKMPLIVLNALKKSRGRKVNAQLMDSLILLSNSLKSGMDIVQGFELVSHDLQPPIADEFALVVKNYQLGTPFEKALDGMTERIDSRMLSYIIKAIIIQRQVGGNLTVIFARLVENIREESKLEEKLDAMTAQQKIQAVVVGIMPFLMVGVMFVFRPDEMISFYTTPIGMLLFLFCVAWIALGMVIIKKIGEIRV